MAFGFSAGDIVLVGQIAYRLYISLKDDPRPATRELENALFSLRCALDHLGRQAKDISARVTAGNHGESQKHEALDSMINSCASTLTDLDRILQKHVVGSECVQHLDQQGAVPQIISVVTDKKDGMSRIRRVAKANWQKLRWSADSQTIINLRIKLQSHTEAINIMMSAFLW